MTDAAFKACLNCGSRFYRSNRDSHERWTTKRKFCSRLCANGRATRPRPLSDRLEEKVERLAESGCWVWLGELDSGGYGTIKMGGRMVKTHRASWIVSRGTIPGKLHVLHSCDVRCCINPDHLFLGTHTENMRDMVNKGRNADNRGIRNGHAKLTEAQVLEIRTLQGSHAEIARRYGVGKSIISYIRRGEAWRSL